MPNEIHRVAVALANYVTWLLALSLLFVAGLTYSYGPVIWFAVGYAAHRVLPKPMRCGVRATSYLALLVVAIVGAVLTHSWAPLVWFAAGWAAFAVSFEPAN